MTNLNDMEQDIRTSIQNCLGIHELALGRIRPRSNWSSDYKEINSYWIVIAPTIPNCDSHYFARVNYLKGSTIVCGREESATRINQQAKIDFDLDRSVMQPDFAYGEGYEPTILGGDGPDFCRVIVQTWMCLARYDLIGSEFFKKSSLLQEIEEFKRQFDFQT